MAISVLSLFSGGGGLDIGFAAVGYKIIWAIDNNPNAVNTYRHNLGNHIVCGDINEINLHLLPHADVVIGGPPCQAFSLAGKRDTHDARGHLVWKYIQIIEHLKPKAFVFENVTGLQSAKNENGDSLINLLKETFRNIGYTIQAQVINAADYGVPQLRKRLIIVGLTSGVSYSFPTPTHHPGGEGLPRYVSVKDALDDLPPVSSTENETVIYQAAPKTEFQCAMRNGMETTDHFMPQMSALDKYIVQHVKPGGNYMDIPSEVNSIRIQRLQRDGGHTTCYGRLHPDRPAYTINTYFNRPNVGCNIHYRENRLITVREALRLQSFPDNYKIISTSRQGKNLIVGNAVPPILANAIAHELTKYL